MIFNKITNQPVTLGLVVWFSVMWSWALQTDSLELAGSKNQGMILAVIVFIINVALSVCIARIFLNLARDVKKRVTTKLYLPALIVLFAFADYSIGWLNALLWIGPQG